MEKHEYQRFNIITNKSSSKERVALARKYQDNGAFISRTKNQCADRGIVFGIKKN